MFSIHKMYLALREFVLHMVPEKKRDIFLAQYSKIVFL